MKRERPRRAVVVGFEYYGRFLASLINEQAPHWSLRYFGSSRAATLLAMAALWRADALVCFGGPGPDLVLVEIARRRRIPVVVIWAGTDVLVAQRDPGLLQIFKQYHFINVSDSPWLVDELRELGVEATYVPVTAVVTPAAPEPMPQDFGVISYLPEPRRGFYGEKAVYLVARALPEIPFYVVGKGAPNPAAPPNVRFLGYVTDMPALLDRCSVLFRFPEHDGKSMLVLEALARGRHVIWNYAFPGVRTALNIASATAQIRELKDAHDRGTLPVNQSGFAYVRERFSRERLASEFAAVLDGAFARRAAPRASKSPRVAISGFKLFAAQIAELMEESPVGWEPRLLSINGNLERLSSAIQLLGADVWYSIGVPIEDRWLHTLARLLRIPRVIHWVGSDLQTLRTRRGVLRACRRSNVAHLAEVSWTLEELASFGLRATLAPLPPRTHAPSPIPPMPEKFTVLLYLPQSRGEFYGRREYERLFRAFAGKPVRFLVVGNGEYFAPPGSDVQALGWSADMNAAYAQTSVLLRFTRHDGLSLMALEALSCGRHVLWSQRFAFSTYVESYADCERELNLLLAQHEAGELFVRSDVAEEVRRLYDRSAALERIAHAWNDAVALKAGAGAPEVSAAS